MGREEERNRKEEVGGKGRKLRGRREKGETRRRRRGGGEKGRK